MERIKCLCGMEADARVMFELEADEKIKIAFQQAAFENEKEEIEVAIGEDRYLIIENIFIICRWEGMYIRENPSILKIYLMIADMTLIIFIQEA